MTAPTTCPYCGLTLTVVPLREHLLRCPVRRGVRQPTQTDVFRRLVAASKRQDGRRR